MRSIVPTPKSNITRGPGSLCAIIALIVLAAAPPSSDKPPILIGEYGSLTGSEATFGVNTHRGVTLAVEQLNAAGGINGRKASIIVYDTQGKSQEAGNAVTRLVTEDKVVAVIGENASSLSLAGGAVCQQYGVPMITPSSTANRVTQVGDMVFRICFIDSYQARVCARFARDHLKATKAAILYDQAQAYSKGLRDDFEKGFIALGGTITSVQAYTGGDQDFSAQLTTIRATNPEIVFAPGYYTDGGNIALQARRIGLNVPLLGGDGWDSAKLAEIGGAAIEGCYYSNHYSTDDQRPEVKSFQKDYQAKYGEAPDSGAALGFDTARLLFDAIARAKSLSGKDLAAAIAQTRDFHGVTGVISIDEKRNAKKPAVIVQIKEGKPRFVASVEP